MPTFFYVVKTRDLKTIKGREEALSKEELINRLRAKGFFIIEIKETRSSTTTNKNKKFKFGRARKRSSIKLHDLAFFARNLSTTLGGGMTLLRSLEIISLQTPSLKLSKILKKCQEDIKEGLSFSEAIAKYPNAFSSLWKGIIEVGEASGNLPRVLEKLSEYLERRMEFERKIKSALIYPLIVLGFALIAVFIFFQFILPKFREIFDQFEIDLPLITSFLFNVSKIMQKFGIFIIGGLIFLVVLFFNSLKKPKFRSIFDRFSLKIPLLKGIIFLSCMERFCSTMHILLESGLPLVSTLDVCGSSIDNSVLRDNIFYMKERVKEGKSLAEEISNLEVFPPLVSEMTKIGEETGTLPGIFEKISIYYQKELTTSLERFISVFEPLLIIFIGVFVGIIVVSLFLPLFQISTLGRGGRVGF